MASAADQPWLLREDWRKREIVSARSVDPLFVFLAYAVFGGMGLLFIWGLFNRDPRAADDHLFELLMGAGISLFALGGVTRFWLRDRLYGDSICRLVTLPGVIGGWFKADVECTLPADPAEPVIVRLTNSISADDEELEQIWQIEQQMTVPPVAGGRSIVRVRLRVPRDRPLRTLRSRSEIESAPSFWGLQVEKNSAGVKFLASFPVPIFDTADAPPSEQQAE